MDVTDVCIKCFADIPEVSRETTGAQIDAIFFGTSFQAEFVGNDERAAFRQLWLGQYLAHFPDLCLLALRRDVVIGYLAGYVPLPGRMQTFPDQHHMPVYADLHAASPAHLHINMKEGERSRGVGGQLVEAFVAMCRTHGVAGVHVVTSYGSRNNAFYRQVGFNHEVRRTTEDRDMIFMGRAL